MSKEAMTLALQALENGKKVRNAEGGTEYQPVLEAKAITALQEALAEPQPEPVAYMHCPSLAMDGKVRPVLSFEKYEGDYASGIYAERIPLYTASQPTKRVPLTEAQIDAVMRKALGRIVTVQRDLDFARAIEAAHGITGEAK